MVGAHPTARLTARRFTTRRGDRTLTGIQAGRIRKAMALRVVTAASLLRLREAVLRAVTPAVVVLRLLRPVAGTVGSVGSHVT